MHLLFRCELCWQYALITVFGWKCHCKIFFILPLLIILCFPLFGFFPLIWLTKWILCHGLWGLIIFFKNKGIEIGFFFFLSKYAVSEKGLCPRSLVAFQPASTRTSWHSLPPSCVGSLPPWPPWPLPCCHHSPVPRHPGLPGSSQEPGRRTHLDLWVAVLPPC